MGSCANNTRRKVQAHRFSWELYKGSIPDGDGYHGVCVLHRCDNRACVNPDHLFLGTQADNIRDMIRKGRNDDRSGERNFSAKLSQRDVNEIRSLAGRLPQRAIAEKFGVSQSQISHIIRGAGWVS